MSGVSGIYPGTFDPITKGHLDVIQRASYIADRLIIAVADDVPKIPLFSVEERVEMVRHDIQHLSLPRTCDIEVMTFKGLLMDFAVEQKASIIVRGLRAVSDFEYEFQLAAMNTKLQPAVQTVFLPASENTQFVASSLVKEIARLGGDVSEFVSEYVAQRLRATH